MKKNLYVANLLSNVIVWAEKEKYLRNYFKLVDTEGRDGYTPVIYEISEKKLKKDFINNPDGDFITLLIEPVFEDPELCMSEDDMEELSNDMESFAESLNKHLVIANEMLKYIKGKRAKKLRKDIQLFNAEELDINEDMLAVDTEDPVGNLMNKIDITKFAKDDLSGKIN